MKKYFYLILVILSSLTATAQTDLGTYMNTYRVKGESSIGTEQKILSETNLRKLIKQLEPFYVDSLITVRRKAYYLTYKKAIIEPDKNQLPAINKMVSACSDKNSSIINQNMDYLKQFPIEAFNSKAKDEIKKLLILPKYLQFSDIYLIAAFLQIGREPIYKLLLSDNTPQKFKWKLQLALARLGDPKTIGDVMKNAHTLTTDDKVVAYLVPDLIYTRQKPAIDYCIAIINEKESNCSSPNAESSAKMVCGYRVMELIAPVIVDFPLVTDASGTVVTNSYPQALEQTRKWFEENPGFEINTTTF
ncbi:MAG: hypothetical protein PF517_05855 [Salinivirgaceae bacterium]|jgi:hypothetical protein|nr:hypothetical protein [Salinivirgaceae bacterium]